MRAAFLAMALIGAPALAACASGGDAPAWFSERAEGSEDGVYPSLRDVPNVTTANTNAAHWAAVAADLQAAGAAVRASPRAEPAAPSDNPSVFLDEARRDLEATRQSHEP